MRRPGLETALAALLSLACSNGPPVVALGGMESPCLDNGDCQNNYFCVEVDDQRLCTASCSGPGSCPAGYVCDLERGVCMPTRTGGTACRVEEARCGRSFDPCCSGTSCAELPPFGSYCARWCTTAADCSTGCCAPIGPADTRVCAPPSYCE